MLFRYRNLLISVFRVLFEADTVTMRSAYNFLYIIHRMFNKATVSDSRLWSREPITYLTTEGSNQTIFADAQKSFRLYADTESISDVRIGTYILVNGLLQKRETCGPCVHLNSTEHRQTPLVEPVIKTT